MKKIKICIIGLGPWGLGTLERIISRANQEKDKILITVDVIEPNDPGVGVHYKNLPDYILLNTKCSHISMFIENQFTDIDNPITGPTLLEWVTKQGYKFANDGYGLTTSGGKNFSPDDFIPRRLLGEYLSWFFQQLIKRTPKNMTLNIHKQIAIDIKLDSDGKELIALDNGKNCVADAVFITTGHTKNNIKEQVNFGEQRKHHILIDYPIKKRLEIVDKKEKVAISGFGLTAIDVLTELTLGRGGKYICDSKLGKRIYIPSGNEPSIFMYSRSGIPPCSRPAISKSMETFGYNARFFTLEKIDELRNNLINNNKLNFTSDLLPLLWDEMKLVYYETCMTLSKSKEAAEELVSILVKSWSEGNFNKQVSKLEVEFGKFNPEQYFTQPLPKVINNSSEYQDLFCKLITDDLVESYKGEIKSATKSAFELFRVVRDTIRYAVDYDGLSAESLLKFKKETASMINRIIVGPPKERAEEILALIDAGIVNIPFGPSPIISYDPDVKMLLIESTKIKVKYSTHIDKLIHAYIPHSTVNNSSSALLSNLYKKGRICDFKIEKKSLGSVYVNKKLNPINTNGLVENTMFFLGPLTEGVKYFNHYIPSPSSRIRAFRDADNCVKQLF